MSSASVVHPSDYYRPTELEFPEKTEGQSLLGRKAARPQRQISYPVRLSLHVVVCVFLAGHLIASANYLAFKARLFGRNPAEVLASPWLLLIWLLEICYFGGSLISAVDNVLPPSNRPRLRLDGVYYPTVDILLPCCKEPTDVPEESIRAALKLDYPTDRFKVLVLDDGGDDTLMAVSHSLQADTGGQVVYLRRIKVPGVPHHFKCGNLNFGLEHSNAEYVVMMDADMILHPSFLRRVLPYIVNSPDIAFVQIPQSFYNLPAGDPLNDGSPLGYDKVLVHRDSFDYATCIGTGALFRRKHLNTIGNFQPHSITEDTTTAYALFREGYRSVYLNEKLQIGLTPWTFEGYIKQRYRWGQGAMQQLSSTWKAMLGKGSKLSFVLKVLYLWHSGFYFLSFLNVVLVATMLSALVFRLKLSVGTEEDNRRLIANLSYTLIWWRVYWFFLWLEVPQSIQSRNRDESHFWWMTPFFIKMIIESFWNYKSTFKFVPTSNIDRNVAKTSENSTRRMAQLSELKHVRIHAAYTLLVVMCVIGRVYIAMVYYGLDDCKESFYVFGLSFFLLTTCAHMMLPVMYIIWPTNVRPSKRKSLLRYDADGVPVFNPEDTAPKQCWSVLLYELVSAVTLAFWVLVLWIVKSGADKAWCKRGQL